VGFISVDQAHVHSTTDAIKGLRRPQEASGHDEADACQLGITKQGKCSHSFFILRLRVGLTRISLFIRLPPFASASRLSALVLCTSKTLLQSIIFLSSCHRHLQPMRRSSSIARGAPVGPLPHLQTNLSSSPSPQMMDPNTALGTSAERIARILTMAVTPISGTATTRLGSPAWRTPARKCPMTLMIHIFT
jgi:hypothetical protein